jgi:hypothetical protein
MIFIGSSPTDLFQNPKSNLTTRIDGGQVPVAGSTPGKNI